MGKKYKVLCLNGPNKGQEIEVEMTYTDEEEQHSKERLKFTVDGINYAGWCRRCGQEVRQEKAEYISNTNGYGKLSVDVFHRWCL